MRRHCSLEVPGVGLWPLACSLGGARETGPHFLLVSIGGLFALLGAVLHLRAVAQPRHLHDCLDHPIGRRILFCRAVVGGARLGEADREAAWPCSVGRCLAAPWAIELNPRWAHAPMRRAARAGLAPCSPAQLGLSRPAPPALDTQGPGRYASFRALSVSGGWVEGLPRCRVRCPCRGVRCVTHPPYSQRCATAMAASRFASAGPLRVDDVIGNAKLRGTPQGPVG